MVRTNSPGSLQQPDHNNHSIQSFYRVRSSLLTAYKQQRQYLITQANVLHLNPRQAILRDQKSYIQSFLGPTHDILLMWNANSTPLDPDIQTFMASCQLHNLKSQCTSAIPINTSARGRHVDFLFGTTLLQTSLRKSGILIFNDSPQSDHRVLFVDFDEQEFFQGSTTDPTAPNQQLLRLSNPSQCRTYFKLVLTYFSAHKITERSNLFISLPADSWASIISSPLRLHWKRHHQRPMPCRTKVSTSTIRITMVTNTHEKGTGTHLLETLLFRSPLI